jgi:hypothetical protein
MHHSPVLLQQPQKRPNLSFWRLATPILVDSLLRIGAGIDNLTSGRSGYRFASKPALRGNHAKTFLSRNSFLSGGDSAFVHSRTLSDNTYSWRNGLGFDSDSRNWQHNRHTQQRNGLLFASHPTCIYTQFRLVSPSSTKVDSCLSLA